MSNPTVVAAVRTAIAANLATQVVTWTQYPNTAYDPATGDSGAPVSTENLRVLLYNEVTSQDDAGTESTKIEGLVLIDDLPNEIGKTDCFTWNSKWNLSSRKPDPTGSFVEFEAYR